MWPSPRVTWMRAPGQEEARRRPHASGTSRSSLVVDHEQGACRSRARRGRVELLDAEPEAGLDAAGDGLLGRGADVEDGARRAHEVPHVDRRGDEYEAPHGQLGVAKRALDLGLGVRRKRLIP